MALESDLYYHALRFGAFQGFIIGTVLAIYILIFNLLRYVYEQYKQRRELQRAMKGSEVEMGLLRPRTRL